MTLPERIIATLETNGGRMSYYRLMGELWPEEKYPKAWRRSINGGPPGVAMVLGATLGRMHRAGVISRPPAYYGQRFGQHDILLL